jgi:hypothetical protein
VDGKHGPYGPTVGGCTHAEAVAQWVNGGGGKCQTLAVNMASDLATLAKEPCNKGVF